MQPQLYRIDNFLLRIGVGLLLLVLVATLALRPWQSRDPRPAKGAYVIQLLDENGRLINHRDYAWSGLKSEPERLASLQERYPNALHIGPLPNQQFRLTRQERYFLAAGIAPIAMILAGYLIRRRENKLLSIWKLLRHNVETDVCDVLANSTHTRKDLEQAVRSLNQRGLGFYAWRHDTDIIEDGRLNSTCLYIERCDACGASVGLSVPASLRKVPRCTYCHAAQSADRLNSLKRNVIRDLQLQPFTQTADEVAMQPHKPLSLGLFIFLIILCWPAAIAYAVYKSSMSHRIA